jgi:hypothetical protein
MSWNFSALGPPMDPKRLLAELARVTRKVVFMCVPNHRNLFRFLFTRLQEKNRGRQSRLPGPKLVEEVMRKENWHLEESGFLDVPPWPDIAMSKEDLFWEMGLKQYAHRLEKRISPKHRLCILDYYNGLNSKLSNKIRRYAFLEKSPDWLKRLWAHHSYQIFTPMDQIQ